MYHSVSRPFKYVEPVRNARDFNAKPFPFEPGSSESSHSVIEALRAPNSVDHIKHAFYLSTRTR